MAYVSTCVFQCSSSGKVNTPAGKSVGFNDFDEPTSPAVDSDSSTDENAEE